jgi:hypothetical protein
MTPEDDFGCTVRAPTLFKGNKMIFGVNQGQARELAFSFIKTLLEGKMLVDKKNKPIRLPDR